MSAGSPVVAGLLLAAGAGRRMGRPKALVELDGVPLVLRAVRVLADAGCGPLLVVTGAAADEVAAMLAAADAPVTVVHAPDWAEGMGASLRAGLDALDAGARPADPDRATRPHDVRNSPTRGAQLAGIDQVLVHLVDLPGVGAAAVDRLRGRDPGPEALARAAYGGVPGHPVLLGRAHWAGVRAAAVGDTGARGYLAGHPDLRLVECGDIADPGDVDTPEALSRYRN